MVYEKEESAEITTVSDIANLQEYYEQIRTEAQEIILKYADRMEAVFVEQGKEEWLEGLGSEQQKTHFQFLPLFK